MGHSVLLGIDSAAAAPDGRKYASLGPGDSSDSGSDVAGLDALDDNDPNAPVDVALRDDGMRSVTTADALSGGASDAAGTGESRSAGGDAGVEGADIGVDRVFTPGAEDEDEDEYEDADLAFLDRADEPGAAQPGGLQEEGGNIRSAHPNPRRGGPVDPDEPEEPESPDDVPEDPEPDGEPPEPDERRPGRAIRATVGAVKVKGASSR